MESQAETELAAQIDGSGSVQIVIRRVVLVPLVVSAWRSVEPTVHDYSGLRATENFRICRIWRVRSGVMWRLATVTQDR